MNKCIYSLKSNENYKKREHVFPAFLGGKKKLKKGVVSDETNELFSKMEAQVSHFSGLSALRDIYGPGKRGKTTFEGKPLLANYDNNPSFFVSMSNNKLNVIDQIVVVFTRGGYKVHFGLKENKNPRESLKKGIEFKNKFYSIKKSERYVFVQDPLGKDNRYVITVFQGKWYVSSKKHIDVFKLMYKVKIGKPLKGDFMNMELITVKEGISLSRVAKDETSTYRVHAKTIFNVYCNFIGQEKLFNKKFNILRDFIYRGVNNADLQCNLNRMIDFKRIILENELHSQSHIVLISENELGINGVVSYYGGAYISVINITRKRSEKISLRIFAIDWKKGNEVELELQGDLTKKFLLTHTEASKEEVLNSKSIFDRNIPKNIGLIIIDLLVELESKKIIVGFDSKDSNFSKVGFLKEIKTYYIHIDNKLDNMTFFGTLLQSLIYIKHVNKSKGYAYNIHDNSEGERKIANYINFLSTFSIVSKHIEDYGYSLDVIFDRRFNSFVSNFLKNFKKGKLNEFLQVKNILESCMLISYNEKYKDSIINLFGDYYAKIKEKMETITEMIDISTLESLNDRRIFISSVIRILDVKKHIGVSEY